MSDSHSSPIQPTWRHAGSIGIVVACVVAVQYWIGWGSLLAPWAVLSPLAILPAIALLIFTYVTRALRLYRHFESDINFALCLRLLMQHNFLVNVLPMRTGEVAFPVLMQRYFEIPARRSVPTLVWFRVLDLHAMMLLLAGTIAWRSAPLLGITFALAWLGLGAGSRPVLVSVV